MKVLLICVGSRGDAEPFCSLGAKLLEEGHQVELFIQPELQSLAPKGANVHLFPFTQFDFYQFVAKPSHGADHENPRVRFVGAVTDLIGELVLPCADAVFSVIEKESIDVIVTSAIARNLAFLASDKYNIPTCLVHLQPLIPTRAFPHYSQTQDCIEALLAGEQAASDANFQTHLELEGIQYEFLKERLAKCYEKNGVDLITYEDTEQRLIGKHKLTTLCLAVSDLLFPFSKDYEANVKQIGALADSYLPKTFVPPGDDDDLTLFLKTKPICVGFGSMPYDQVKMILEVLETLDQKAVLVGDALKLPEEEVSEWVKENVRQVSAMPYAWLLPKCKLMMSHGGAGVTHATLRAGIPVVIAPYMGDQFFFAEYLQKKGLGARAGESLAKATKEDIITALQAGEACIENARKFGESARAQVSGVDRMYEVLSDLCM